ncbi:TonB-dependent receptor [Vibrio cyclitrophicus]|nr:TonB-dependent receptor [Vibrio cyclitrophicus]UPR34233.1 TonB-dependent receptor [Vibrio cyclitrophicus]
MSERSLLIRKPLSIAVAVICTSLSANVLAQEEAQATDEQMVVTATRTEMALKQAPASMSVITAQDIEDSPGITLADIVAESTSVESDFDSTRAGRQMISIRGMDSDYTLIMVNGRRLSSASAIIRGNDFDLSTIPADSIERVEIIRGPMSALYGSDGMGGTINIITKAPENDWSSTVSMDNSSPMDGNGGQEYSVGLTTSGALIEDELFARVSVNQTSRNAWQPYTGNGREDITALEERDTLSLLANLTWNATDNQTIDLDLGYSDDKRDGLAEYATGANPVDSKVVRNSQAITHSGFWSWGDTQVRYSRENVTDNDAADSDESYSSDIEELTQIIEASATTYLGESHTVTFGMDYQLSKLTNMENLDNGTSEAYQGALFVQDQWLMTEQLTATIGGRLDKHELYGEEFSPRVYLVHQTTNDLIIKGGVGKAFKAPSLTQNQHDYRVNSCKGGCDLHGNEDLNPETSWNYELAAVYTQPRWSVEGALFRNEINDLIDRGDIICKDGDSYDDGSVSLTPGCVDSATTEHYKAYRTYENISEAVIQGAELTGQFQITDEWGVSGNYTFLDTEDKSTGEELLERYKHSGFVKLNWSPTYDLSTFVSARYRGERQIDSNIAQDAYTTLNLGAVYSVNASVRLRAGISNLTDESVSDELEYLGYVEEPRTYYVGMTADF